MEERNRKGDSQVGCGGKPDRSAMSIWPRLDQPAIITPNHQGYLDGPALAFLAPKPILFGVDPDFSTREPWRRILMTIGRITHCRMVPMAPGSRRGIREMLYWLRDGAGYACVPRAGLPRERPIREPNGLRVVLVRPFTL